MRKWWLLLSLFGLFTAAECPPRKTDPTPAPQGKEKPNAVPEGSGARTGNGTSQQSGQNSGQQPTGKSSPGSSPNSAPNQAQLDSIKLEKYKQKNKGKSPERGKGEN